MHEKRLPLSRNEILERYPLKYFCFIPFLKFCQISTFHSSKNYFRIYLSCITVRDGGFALLLHLYIHASCALNTQKARFLKDQCTTRSLGKRLFIAVIHHASPFLLHEVDDVALVVVT